MTPTDLKTPTLLLLGGFQFIGDDGTGIMIPARKAKALLAYLAMVPGETRSRDALASLLWEDSDDSRARHSLRQTLASLRKVLPGGGESILEADSGSVRIAAGSIEVDAPRFEALAASVDAEPLRRAALLYQGEFLEGFDPRSGACEDWLMQVRSSLHERSIAVHGALLGIEAGDGTVDAVVRIALRLLSLDPLREDAHRRLMECYERQGRHGAALRQYRTCRNLLERELGIEPEAATEALYRELVSRRKRRPSGSPEGGSGDAGLRTTQSVNDVASGEPPQLRQAAVLVAVLTDFTRLAGELDAEQLYEVLTRYYSRIDAVVTRFGGRVVRQFSETVMAVFGAPTTRGNDVARGVHAGAEAISTAVDLPGVDIAAGEIGAGLTSGRVLVAMAPSLAQPEPVLTGEAVNGAVRLAARARPGELLLGESAYRATADGIVAEPVSGDDSGTGDRSWRLRELLASGEFNAPIPMVGRVQELRQFETALDTCLETGCGQAFLVRGEAGIGKTRLVTEFMRAAGHRGFLAHRALVLDFGVTEAGEALSSLARQILYLEPGSPGPALQAAIRNAVATGMFPEEDEAPLHELLGAPLNVSLKSQLDARSAGERQAGLMDVFGRLAQGGSTSVPRLLVVEDIHWADHALMVALARLAAVASAARILLVMTSRVEGEPLDPSWRGAMHGSPMTTIDLAPLAPAEALQLARGIAGDDEELARQCVGRSGGNPLFLEQLLRTPREAAFSIPDSVQSIVWARLDGLAAADRHAARAAAVLGQRFDPGPLRFLVEDDAYLPERLVENRLVRPESEGFLFAHALIRDGIYASILPSQRRKLHRRAADWYRLRDPVLRARHLLCIGDPAAGEACLEAARSESAAWRYDQALELISAALELELRDIADVRFRLLNLRGIVQLECGRVDDALASQEEALAAAGDSLQACRARIDAAAGLIVKDRHERALELLAAAESSTNPDHCPNETARIHYHRGNALFPLGRIEECLESHTLALEFARLAGSRELEARALSGLGDAWYQRGRMITAFGHFDQCVRLCRESGFGRIEIPNLAMRGICNLYCLRMEEAARDAQQAAAMAARAGHPRDEALSRDIVATVHIATGTPDVAAREAEAALALTERIGAGLFNAEVRSMLGRLAAESGDRERGRALVLGAWETCRQLGLAYAGPMILGVLARVTDDPEQRHWALEEGERLLQTDSVSHNFLYFYESAIAVRLDTESWDEAEEYADKLRCYTQDEPLPMSEFVADSGRALARAGRGERSGKLRGTLSDLAGRGSRARLVPWTRRLEAAVGKLDAGQ